MKKFMSDIIGTVTEIQRSSFFDGPGIRTTVFLKGCPLNCRWCHNPESISPEPQWMYYADKCIGCKNCDKGCFSGARMLCGERMSPTKVLEHILRDKDYFGEDGGVTFTGGEPFYQAEFLECLIDLCRQNGINTAVETSMVYFYPEILKKLDLIIADLKIWDDELHKKFVGCSNKKIKENILAADELGVPIIIHTPIIPTVNSDIKNVTEIKNFIKNLKNLKKYELLPYHPLGVDKQRALGMETTPFEIPDDTLMTELRKYADIS